MPGGDMMRERMGLASQQEQMMDSDDMPRHGETEGEN